MKSNEMNIGYLIIEMCSSIKEIDKRIDELKYVLNNNMCKEESINILNDRIRRLFRTKFYISFSLIKLKNEFLNSLYVEPQNDIEKHFLSYVFNQSIF